jgi:hypothetical protein
MLECNEKMLEYFPIPRLNGFQNLVGQSALLECLFDQIVSFYFRPIGHRHLNDLKLLEIHNPPPFDEIAL